MSAPAPHARAAAWQAIVRDYRIDEACAVAALTTRIALSAAQRASIESEARRLAAHVRSASAHSLSAEAFLQRYSLSSREGVVLMCLAEALLRIPDAETADALIRDKLDGASWKTRAGAPLLVNASSWALMLTGRLAGWHDAEGGPAAVLQRLVARAGEPVVRSALRHAVEIMAEQFVAGTTMDEALDRAARQPAYRYSYDMLGEAARTAADAARYRDAYHDAIDRIRARAGPDTRIEERSGVSIKLSALHPRYEMAQRERVFAELLPVVIGLCRCAAEAGMPLTIDAEEADRLQLSLEIFERLAQDPALARWDGLGIAVQAYQKRALAVCDWIAQLADDNRRRFMVRLVKGAYWDTEIKLAQVLGLDDYPVYTRKAATDVSYMACAQSLLNAQTRTGGRLYPQFATHNCHTVAYILDIAGDRGDFEFQKLHGMGDALYATLMREHPLACRVYAPVGSHRDLLAYLVRRLLENGANTSFVHQVTNPDVPLESLVADPLSALPAPYVRSTRVPLPSRLYSDRVNSRSMDLSDPAVLLRLQDRISFDRSRIIAPANDERIVTEPADRRRIVGTVHDTSSAELSAAAEAAHHASRAWDDTSAHERARILERAADGIEAHADTLISLLAREAGKCLPDGVSEVREAADFLRYYAARARAEFAAPVELEGPVGESNRLELAGRGVFACISPWNFPLAIFVGQVSAALAAGNAVVAKAAVQTPLIAARAVELLHEAGVPRDVLHLVAGTGPSAGAPLVRHPLVDGVAFTGSFETALAIQRELAARDGPIVPFIAETGGLNAMIADSTALPEQVVADILGSAFNSAGQRCSALRVLLVQREAAPRLLEMLAGAMAELRVGDPGRADTDVGPVIDADAQAALQRHIDGLARHGTLIGCAPCGAAGEHGTFVAPVACEIELADLPQREVFGPVLHVVRYDAHDVDEALETVARTRYGLTLGIHSRIDEFATHVRRRLPVGNTYVNRNMIGAVVGVQPFGGEGYSGTGPKSGGPRYLHRFAVERCVTVNTAAVGGSADLLSGENSEMP